MQLITPEQGVRRWLEELAPSSFEAPLLVAVSGGSDSLGLLQALSASRDEFGLQLYAATVDHKLRTEARDEAEFVHAFCVERDIPHAILDIEWGDGTKNQARARKLRYRALAGHARNIGARFILTGHTRDDQAETFLIRLNAGSNWWGLAGMSAFAPLPVWPEGEGCVLARPMLECDREDVRAALSAAGIKWVEDPSNNDPKYERVRVRRLLTEYSGLKEQVLTSRARLHNLRKAYTDFLKDWVKLYISWLPGGSVKLNSAQFFELPDETRFRLMQMLLPCVAGRENTPKTDGLTACLGELSAGAQGNAVTLSGCRILLEGNAIWITPEVLDAGDCVQFADFFIWSGRVRLNYPDVGWAITAWAEHPVPETLSHAKALPYHVRKTLPAYLDADGRIACVLHFETEMACDVQDLAQSRLENWLNAKT